IDEVTSAIRRGNVNLPVGSIYGADQSLTLQANGQLNDSKEYQQLIVAYRNGAPVRLKDVATVIDGVENDKNAGWFNGTRSFTMAVQRQPGTNTIEVVDKIKQLLPGLQEQLPASVRLDILNDRSAQIRESVHDVQFTLMLTVGLVVMVIFLFLRNVRATIIPSLSLPVSILATFAVMYVLGFSLNNLSLMALTLCVGFVVDDAIVVLENIVRRMDLGEPPRAAALNGAREVGFTVVSMTISLVAVFIPILFMGGILGRLFQEFAVTISLAILFSGLVSLSLTPMLCSRYLRPTAEHNQSWFYRLTEKMFDGVLKVYSSSLRTAMNFGKTTLTLALILVGVTGWIFTQVPKGFIPNDDYGFIFGSTEGIQGISFEEMKKIQEQVVAIVRQDPNVEAVSSNVGAGGRNSTSNSGSMFVKLKPLKNRKVSSEQFINQIRPKLAKVAGVRVFLFNPPAIRIGGISSRSVYQATLQGTDIAQLNAAAQQLERKMRGIKELQDVTSDLENRNPELEVTIDRKQAAAYNLSVEQIQSALNDAFGTRQISTIYTESNEYQVIAELKPEFQRDIESVTLLPIRSSTGKLVPLGAVASVHESVGPLIINHVGQLTSVTISFGLRPDISLSQGTALIRQASNGLLPADVTLSFQGTAQVFEESMKNLNWLLLIAVLVIYLVLGILYESFIHPFTILSGLPSAGMGALLTLLLFKQELNVYGFVGLIMLIGIVKKNAIMMIDFALETQRSSVSSPEEAIYLACVVRFRPIMM
ncbi:MAG TPA: efflux RND transporter permease subunit, partial [Acidobacteriota bacterium]|nr:efflux RND transporter permease subunit [Acidobacteriota bacterium]